MAAYQTGGKGPYKIGPKRLAGGVEIGRVSTGTKNRALAHKMEAAVEELALQGWGDLVKRLGRDLRLPDLYAAKLEGPHRLQELRVLQSDPPLEQVLVRAETYIADARARNGVGELRGYLDSMQVKGARLSWLQQPGNLNELYAHARETSGKPPNSLRRSLHRAVCEILSHELGRGRMLAILSEVKKPAGVDERTVDLTPTQIQKLLAELDDEVLPVIEMCLLTGMDLTPVLRIRRMDFDDDGGEGPTVRVDDRKAPSRKRTIPLPPRAAAILRMHSAGLKEDQRIFDLSRWQVRGRFDAARTRAGLSHLRIKDLRGVFATNFLLGGGSPKDLMGILGHSSMTMTLRYVRRLPARQGREMEAAAEKMGLSMRDLLKVEKGGGV